ncbi:MAG: class I SAM-dependent methyltransferase [Candidatus Bathyarchaeota archaeon]|nr:MAG: class I SAM-dependent methyltransferase [Candidatus Bathyarchaeota archaeon]
MIEEPEIKKYYDARAQTYDAIFDSTYFKIHDLITWKYVEPYIPMDPESLVLDAGGGTGRWSIRIAKKGCRVFLMDISKEMLAIAEGKVREEGLQDRIAIKNGDISKTDYSSESFDMILCEHTLFLFKNPDLIIKELRRILKKRARLIVSVHNLYAQSVSTLADRPTLNNVQKALDTLHRKRYTTLTKEGKVKAYTWTPDEFRAILERNGFIVEKIIGKGFTMPLRISKELFMKKECPKNLYQKILEFELAFCEKPDALALAGILQAVAYKPP